MTPKSKKVAQIRERIEEWQRAEHAPGSWSDPASRRTTTDSGTGSSATAQGAQQQIGEIESVGASSSAARSQSQQSNQQPSQQPVEQMAQQPRLVPLTPEVQRRGKAPARTAPKAIAGRSDTRASRESKFSVQSSNVPPSLFGSDRSTFSSPLLGPLPHMSVPSDIASLRTAAASQTLPRESEPPAPVRVQQAVASPVSIGGRKKQSLVVDARSASDEVLLDTQSVKSASPSVVHTSSSSSPSSGVFTSSSSGMYTSSSGEHPAARTRTQDVLTSPHVPTTAVLTAEERRAWAKQNPQQRPPLELSETPTDASEDLQAWDAKLRRRADTSIHPMVAASPADALQSKSYGGLHPPEQREQRKEHIHGALASLERKSPRPRKTRHNRDPLRSPDTASAISVPVSSSRHSMPPVPEPVPAPVPAPDHVSDPAPDHVSDPGSDDSGFDLEDPSAGASPALSSRPPFRMGRHGSSPLNPNTASGSTAPPMPPGLIKRLTGTMRRKRSSMPAQTPLPRRWWRNIKESMYAPIPPIHVEHSPQQQWPSSSPAPLVDADAGHKTGEPTDDFRGTIEELPAHPFRRHSFSGSTDMEQQKMTAALSPRENMRRKLTLAERVRGVLRGRRSTRDQVLAPSLQQPHSGADYSLKLAETIPFRHDDEPWSSNNPFAAGAKPVRRASFDTLSVHEMAEVDRAEMHSRLNNLISSHSSN
ncbi:hypothetical protein GGH17_003485, partial [Coemansia sp. RSA 788]